MESSYVDSLKGKLLEGTKITGSENQRLKFDDDKLEDVSRKVEQLFCNDSNKLTQFLPEEVWQFVSTKLKEGDLQNYVNSSPFFRELRLKDLIIYLFPNVIDIMAPFFEKRKLKRKLCYKSEQEIVEEFAIERTLSDDEIQEAREATTVVKLWRSTILNCRLVCFAWNRAVEKCYERAEMSGIKELVKDLDPRSPLNTVNIETFRYKFSFSPQGQRNLPERFMEHFEESHGYSKNPFFGRFAFFNTQLAREQHDEYVDSLIKMLQLFGEQIWYCKLSVSPLHAIFDLNPILNLMPNLKYLKVISMIRYPERKNYATWDLPRLEKLQALSLELLETPLATELIRVNSHVQFLELCCCEVDENVGS